MSRAGEWFLGIAACAPLVLIGLPDAAAPQDPVPPAPVETPEETPVETPEAGEDPVETEDPQAGGETPPAPAEQGGQGEASEEPAAGGEQVPVEASEQASELPAEPAAGEPAAETPERTVHEAPTEAPPPGEPGLPPGSELPSGAVDPVGPANATPTIVAPEPEVLARPEPLPFPPLRPGYRSLVGVVALFDALAAAVPELARPLELGTSLGGLGVPALEFGAPGPLLLEERPTLLLIGGLDGLSLSGGEAVLAATHALLSSPGDLPPNVTIVAVPWASPGPLTRMLEGAGDGANARPTDNDRDGLRDEDGPDDLDGDGMILDMLIEHPAGPWVRGGDGRFLVPARPGAGTRYLWTREGKDDDGDGRFNEDAAGGVVLDRNFPLHREGPWQDPSVGRLPMSEPLVRALADLVRSRRTALVLLFQGNHGALATPNGAAARDEPVYRRVTEAFLAATGRAQAGTLTLEQAHGEPTPGAALDWFNEVIGALSLEVAAWGPRVEGVEGGGPVTAQSARFSAGGLAPGRDAPLALEDRPRLRARESAWAAWLDNTRGGLGFVDWQPVELGGGRQGLVGGWQPFTIENPPAESLASALEGLPEFVADLAASMPRLEIRSTSTRDGDLCHISAQVKNLGLLPTGLAGGRPAESAGELTLDLHLPPGAQLVAGELHVEFDHLLGRELSAEQSWVVVAPVGSVLRLSASSAWTGSVEREAKP